MAADKGERHLHLMEAIVVNTSDAIIVTEADPIDPPGPIIVYVNDAFCRLTGYAADEVLGKNPRILQGAKTERAQLDKIRAALVKKEPVLAELVNYRKDGSEYWVELSIVPVFDDRGQCTHFVCSKRDVTDRRRTEEELRNALALLRSTLESTFDGILVVDANLRTRTFNRRFAEMWGASEEMLRNLEDRQALAHALSQLKDPQGFLNKALQLYAKPEAQTYDTWELLDGRVLERYSQPHRIEGKPVGRVFTYRDITERKLAEEALRTSEMRNRALLEALPDSIFRLDKDGTFLDYNPGRDFTTLVPPSEFLGRNLREILPPDVAELCMTHLESALAMGGMQVFEYQLPMEGQLRHYEARLVASGEQEVLAVVRDATERKRLEARLQQAQKMETVGRLAGGVAHDFNNLLTVLEFNAYMLLADLAADDPHRAVVEEMLRTVERAGALTNQLLAFSRRQMVQPAVVDLNAIVGDMGRMLRRLIREDIRLVVALRSQGRVRIDPNQFEQVLTNLVVNARDAMQAGGAIVIETDDLELREPLPGSDLVLPPGPYTTVSVTDTGHGMTAEVKAHLFEPFFTTKAPGQGTGLGLFTVYGIVKQSGGDVSVYSEPGLGARFTVYLPRVAEAEEAARVPAAAAPPAPRRGTETILLVEDDSAVRHLIRRTLPQQGYTVLEAADGHQALEIARQHDGPIDLLLTDVVMPGMSGGELATALAAQRPELKILYMSAYAEDAIVQHGVLRGGRAFLQKPFTPELLNRKVRETLDAG